MLRIVCGLLLCLNIITLAQGEDKHISPLKIKEIIPASAKLNVPFGVDLDAQGNLYLVEFDGGRIFSMAPEGPLTHISGITAKDYKGDGQTAEHAVYNDMHNLAVTPAGDIYIADTWNNVIRKIDHQTKLVSTVAGTGAKGYGGDDGPALKAKFNGVFCISLNHANDKIYIADLSNKRVRMLDLKTHIVSNVAGNGKSAAPTDGSIASESPLVDPRAVASDSKDNVYILERNGNCLRVVHPDGKIYTVAGQPHKGKADGIGLASQMNGPKHLCIDLQDRVIIADAENHLIRRFDPTTQEMTTLPIPNLKRPHGVYVHTDGMLFVVDSYNNRVLSVQE